MAPRRRRTGDALPQRFTPGTVIGGEDYTDDEVDPDFLDEPLRRVELGVSQPSFYRPPGAVLPPSTGNVTMQVQAHHSALFQPEPPPFIVPSQHPVHPPTALSQSSSYYPSNFQNPIPGPWIGVDHALGLPGLSQSADNDSPSITGTNRERNLPVLVNSTSESGPGLLRTLPLAGTSHTASRGEAFPGEPRTAIPPGQPPQQLDTNLLVELNRTSGVQSGHSVVSQMDLYRVAMVPARGGEIATNAQRRTNVITAGITTHMRKRKRPSMPSQAPPPPEPADTQTRSMVTVADHTTATGADSVTTNRHGHALAGTQTGVTAAQKSKAMHLLVQKVRHSMFTVHATPDEDERDQQILSFATELVAIEVYGSSPLPFPDVRKRCVKSMWEVRKAFRNFAEHSVEYLFDLALHPSHPSATGSNPSVDSDYMRTTVKDLLAQPDYSFFHVVGTVEVKHFEHRCFRDAIANIVWDNFQGGTMLRADSLQPLIALVAASFVAALERRRSGVVAPTTMSDENFQDLCRSIHTYIVSLFAGDHLAHDAFVRRCGEMISSIKSKWGERVPKAPRGDADF